MRLNKEKIILFLKRNYALLLVILVAALFSTFIMTQTLSYSVEKKEVEVASKVWSDFQSHIPLIRSFSSGDNLPPEYPLFSGEKIRYHFFFYLMVGMVEKAGVRFDIALNSLSIIGMTGMLVSIYLLTKKLSKSSLAGGLAMIMVVFNSSLTWIYFLDQKGLSWNSIKDIPYNTTFYSFGPYDDNLISAFWNLNVYTNQRHLAFSFFMMFIAVWAVVYNKNRYISLIGIVILGVMSWLHKAILMILLIILGLFFLFKSTKRTKIFIITFIGGVLALPGLIYLNHSSSEGTKILLGFIYNATTWKEFEITNPMHKWLVYWWLNMGFLPLATAFGYYLTIPSKFHRAKDWVKKLRILKTDKTVWLLSAIATFIIANTIAFATDNATNHKMINYSLMIFSIFAAIFLVKLFKEGLFGKIFSVMAFLILILGGILDLFPIVNDQMYGVKDKAENPISKWIDENTPKDARFFNTTYNTLPITSAGRRIYFGWDYFAWSIGYDTVKRRDEMIEIIQAKYYKEDACKYFQENKLSYIYTEISDEKFIEIVPGRAFFDNNFVKVSPENLGVNIYDINKSCIL